MSAAPAMVSDMLITVKSREVQRATLAEMRDDRKEAAKHFLAAAHLELVLADDRIPTVLRNQPVVPGPQVEPLLRHSAKATCF